MVEKASEQNDKLEYEIRWKVTTTREGDITFHLSSDDVLRNFNNAFDTFVTSRGLVSTETVQAFAKTKGINVEEAQTRLRALRAVMRSKLSDLAKGDFDLGIYKAFTDALTLQFENSIRYARVAAQGTEIQGPNHLDRIIYTDLNPEELRAEVITAAGNQSKQDLSHYFPRKYILLEETYNATTDDDQRRKAFIEEVVNEALDRWTELNKETPLVRLTSSVEVTSNGELCLVSGGRSGRDHGAYNAYYYLPPGTLKKIVADCERFLDEVTSKLNIEADTQPAPLSGDLKYLVTDMILNLLQGWIERHLEGLEENYDKAFEKTQAVVIHTLEKWQDELNTHGIFNRREFVENVVKNATKIAKRKQRAYYTKLFNELSDEPVFSRPGPRPGWTKAKLETAVWSEPLS